MLFAGYIELNERNNVSGAVHYFNMSHELGDTDSTHNLAIIQSFYKAFHPDPVRSNPFPTNQRAEIF